LAWANILQDVLTAVVQCIGTAQGTLNGMGWGCRDLRRDDGPQRHGDARDAGRVA
jgi:hypothetical protein